jgi:hypothetical protein
MKVGNALSLLSQGINITIFIYLNFALIKLNVLDIWGLLISAFGLSVSLIASIVSTIESKE